MRRILHPGLERARTHGEGLNAAFLIPGPCGSALSIVASDGSDWAECDLPGEPWEHVSVKARDKHLWRAPNWKEMCFVKDLFWTDEEWVLQFHPAKSEHVNTHPAVLHMWRLKTGAIPTPPKRCV